jgi:hypothetical protein
VTRALLDPCHKTAFFELFEVSLRSGISPNIS